MRRRLEAALQSIVDLIPTERHHLPGEAPLELTQAYARFIVANGFARLGERDRALQLGHDARVALAEANATDDPIHGFLIAAFSNRLDQANACMPRDWPLAESVVQQLEALDRVRRYKVDQLREISPTLAADFVPYEPPEATRWVDRGAVLSSDPTLDALRSIPDPEVRAARIVRMFDAAKPDPAELRACLDALIEMPAAHAVPAMNHALRRMPRESAVLCASALFATARFDRRYFPSGLFAAFRQQLDRKGAQYDGTIPTALRALRRLGMTGEIDALVHWAARASRKIPLRVELAIAGARAFLGDAEAGAPFKTAFDLLGTRSISYDLPADRSGCELVRAIAAGATHADLDFALAQLAAIAERFERVTDALGTSTHYCISVLHVIESLVVAITELALTLPDAHDAGNRTFLASRYVHRDVL